MCFRFKWLNKRTKKVHKTEHLNFLGKLQNLFVAILSHWTKLLPYLKVWISDKCRKIFIQFSWVCKQWSIKKKGITLHMSKVKIFINTVKIWNFLNLHQHLSMKEGSLFCFVLFCRYEIHWTGMLQIMFWCLWKALNEEGCMGLVPWHLDLWCKSLWILNIFHWKLN